MTVSKRRDGTPETTTGYDLCQASITCLPHHSRQTEPSSYCDWPEVLATSGLSVSAEHLPVVGSHLCSGSPRFLRARKVPDGSQVCTVHPPVGSPVAVPSRAPVAALIMTRVPSPPTIRRVPSAVKSALWMSAIDAVQTAVAEPGWKALRVEKLRVGAAIHRWRDEKPRP